MSTPPQTCETPCETCAKQGLPILLTRYAVLAPPPAPNLGEDVLPAVSGTFHNDELAAIPLGAGAYYGLRLLRSGYVYVFDEARGTWAEYFVTQTGHFTRLPARALAVLGPRPAPAEVFQCARNGNAPLAGVITIANPAHATRVWIAYSDVEWTNELLGRHSVDAQLREQHMQRIDIEGGKVVAQPGTAPIDEVDHWLPEFILPRNIGVARFYQTNPFPFAFRDGQAAALKAACTANAPAGGAAIVALHDPVGVVAELAYLMELRKLRYLNEPGRRHSMSSAGSIEWLRHTLREQAKLAEVAANEAQADVLELPPSYRPTRTGHPAEESLPADPQGAQRLRESLTLRELEEAAESKWARYTHDREGRPRFDDDARLDWQARFRTELAQFDAEAIAPLAHAHVGWLRSTRLARHMAGNYDHNDPRSGEAYVATVEMMLRSTGDKQPCRELYQAWLQAGDLEAGNLLMRALVYNQQALAEQVAAIDDPPLDGRAFPAAAVLTLAREALAQMPESAQARMGALLDTIAGTILNYMKRLDSGHANPHAAAALYGINGLQFVRTPVRGKRDQFVQAYVNTIFHLDPTLSSRTRPNELGRAVAAQLRLLRIEQVPLEGTRTQGWYLLLDKRTLRNASALPLEGQALADHLARSVRSADQLHRIDVAAWRRLTDGPHLSLLGGLLEVINLCKLVEDVQRSMTHNQEDARRRLHAGVASVTAAVVQTSGEVLRRLPVSTLRIAPGINFHFAGRVLSNIGAVVGFGASLYLGVADYLEGEKQAQMGNTGLAELYHSAGQIGVTFSFVIVILSFTGRVIPFLAGPLFIVAALLFIGTLYLSTRIESEKDNDLQAWLRRCHFGNGPDRYDDVEFEQQQLAIALQE